MSLDFVEGKIDALRSEAENLIDDYNRTQFEVATDPNLTAIGKREQLAPIHESVHEKLKALRQQERDVVKTKLESLQRSLFGLPASVANDPNRLISYRDAQDRAAKLEDHDDAHEAYQRAVRSDDTTLISAILHKALERGWSKVTDDHLSRNPSVRSDINDLNKMREYDPQSLAITAQYMLPALSVDRPVSVPIAARDQLSGSSASGQMERF